MKVTVFDTGAGGRLFTKYLSEYYPGMEIEVIIDDENSPYGDKTEDEIFALTDMAIEECVGETDVIVLACNTATAAAIDRLRIKYPKQVFIGFEPMLKTADKISRTGRVMVLATNATKKAERYKRLKSRFSGISVIEPNCDVWATKIDSGRLTRKDIENALQGKLEGVDVIILACTHYVAISEQIQRVVGENVAVINPFRAVVKYIKRIML